MTSPPPLPPLKKLKVADEATHHMRKLKKLSLLLQNAKKLDKKLRLYLKSLLLVLPPRKSVLHASSPVNHRENGKLIIN